MTLATLPSESRGGVDSTPFDTPSSTPPRGVGGGVDETTGLYRPVVDTPDTPEGDCSGFEGTK